MKRSTHTCEWTNRYYAENDRVSFELEKGQRGMNAVKVTLIK